MLIWIKVIIKSFLRQHYTYESIGIFLFGKGDFAEGLAGAEESSDASTSFAHNYVAAFSTQLCLLEFETCYLLSAFQMEVSINGEYNSHWHGAKCLLPEISVTHKSLVGILPVGLAGIFIAFRRIR
jgi:hypothetical protein